jgi:hypothetical protein
MKKMIFLVIILMSVSGFSGFSQDIKQADNSKTSASQIVEIYYFHMTNRCPTCLAVESETEAALKKLYPAQMESGTMTFKSLNLEEEVNAPLAEKLKVSGQTLLIVKGDKNIDMTGDGFLYARTNPEKLQEKLKVAIDPLL